MGLRKDEGNDPGSSGWVNTDVAAEVLGVSARSVRNYILHGDLVARKRIEGINERYLVSVDSLYALRDRRKQEGKPLGNRRTSSRSERSSEETTAVVRETAANMLRETLASLETHIAQNAELRARLELTQRAEGALQEELERERQERREAQQRAVTLEQERMEAQRRIERLVQEQAQLEEEHSRIQEERGRLREELEAERARGFWGRLFGG